jgi:alanine-glyoxylate transaminase/serine-glyoxylate transaminase/serine-pyruvate transaminase
MLKDYYRGSGKRAYHHTAPVNMIYALHEALTIVLEEGLEARHARHARLHRRLRAGLESMGIKYVPEHSLHTLNCIHIPEGADDAAVRAKLLEDYSIEIGAGLGPFAGKAWRIGLMGHSASQANVDLVLAALVDCLE